MFNTVQHTQPVPPAEVKESFSADELLGLRLLPKRVNHAQLGFDPLCILVDQPIQSLNACEDGRGQDDLPARMDCYGYGQLWAMEADGSNRYVLTDCSPPSNCDTAWSPDGQLILFETNRGGPIETWLMNAAGSDQHSLFSFPYGAGRLPWQSVQR